MEQHEGIMKSLIVFAGIVLGAFLLGKSIERFKKEDRYISVKGFSEKEVKADLVIWSMKIRVANDDLVKGNVALASAKNKVTSFLTEKGVRAQEIVPMDLKVIDRQANEYLQPNSAQQLRYIIEETIEVRSNQVDAIQKISRMTSELLSAGIALSNKNEWGGSGLEYIFTQLNAIKPAMLSEAIKNAKGAAEQFTRESETKLGKMRKASQGLFSIQDRDQSLSSTTEGGNVEFGNTDLYKKIRVVISVDYSIE